jgi:hypothetical protein
MFKLTNKELLILVLLTILYIAIRTVHFNLHLDFSTDQATSSSQVLDIVRKREPILIGPRFTLEYNGRYTFFGPAPYYFQMIFLLLGDFEPIMSSYYFMLFSALMIFPLFLGMKLLINQKAAFFMVIFYSLLPFFLNYSRFLWNPNSQFVLLPLLVLLMGIFHKKKNVLAFFILSLSLGIILEFHYIFSLIILGLLIYYFFILKLGIKYFLVFIAGIILGMSPLIVFDLRNHFYISQTIYLFIQHWQEVILPTVVSSGAGHGDPHYRVSFVFFGLVILSYFLRKIINLSFLVCLFLVLLFWSSYLYFPKPNQAYGMSKNWNYLYELKAHEIIKKENPLNYNVANLIYDPQAEVQKYLNKKDNIKMNDESYLSNDYLFVLSSKRDVLIDPAFEIKNLLPAKIIKTWSINKDYNLYLARRTPK